MEVMIFKNVFICSFSLISGKVLPLVILTLEESQNGWCEPQQTFSTEPLGLDVCSVELGAEFTFLMISAHQASL
jgi:hypothetical protein